MNPLKSSLQRLGSKLPLLFVMLLLPWGWSAFFVPLWISAVSLALVLPVALLMLIFVIPPSAVLAPRRATDGDDIPDEKIIAMRQQGAEQRERMAQTIASVHSHVSRWSETPENSQGALKWVHDGMGKVMKHCEEQMALAARLLGAERAPGDPEGPEGAWLSLPDYIRAYEIQLNTVTERMLQFSSASNDFDEDRSKIRSHTVVVDEALDELRAMANRTGQLALESSVLASGADVNHQGVVALTDRIRTISEQTHELTRRIRRSLDAIRSQITESHKAMHGASDIAERAARDAKFEVLQLNLTMTEKTKDVRATLEEMNKLGIVIQDEISRIIIAMQFQDITQQRLERLHQPALTRVIGELRSIGAESSKMKGDVSQWLQPGKGEAEAPFQLVRRGADGPVEVRKEGVPPIRADDLDDERKPASAKESGGSVELF